MQPTSRIAQGYGYAVCLICIITILICTGTIVNSLFNVSQPLRAEGRGMNLTSYSAYKRAHSSATRPMPPAGQAGPPSSTTATSEAEMRQMFEDERADQIGDVRFRSMRNVVSSVFVLLIAGGLFFMHWRWLRRADPNPA